MIMDNEDKYISLIIEASEDIAHLKKEIIALRNVLIDYYPGLQGELLSDLTTNLEIDDLYVSITNKIKYNPLDNKEYHQEIEKLIKVGYTDKYPFSI